MLINTAFIGNETLFWCISLYIDEKRFCFDGFERRAFEVLNQLNNLNWLDHNLCAEVAIYLAHMQKSPTEPDLP